MPFFVPRKIDHCQHFEDEFFSWLTHECTKLNEKKNQTKNYFLSYFNMPLIDLETAVVSRPCFKANFNHDSKQRNWPDLRLTTTVYELKTFLLDAKENFKKEKHKKICDLLFRLFPSMHFRFNFLICSLHLLIYRSPLKKFGQHSIHRRGKIGKRTKINYTISWGKKRFQIHQ